MLSMPKLEMQFPLHALGVLTGHTHEGHEDELLTVKEMRIKFKSIWCTSGGLWGPTWVILGCFSPLRFVRMPIGPFQTLMLVC